MKKSHLKLNAQNTVSMKDKVLFSVFFLLFNLVCFSQNIDSIVNSKPKTNDELINIARELIYKEVVDETPDINNIRAYQNYLNEDKKSGLEDIENLMLDYFLQDWDNALQHIDTYHFIFRTGRGQNTAKNLSDILSDKVIENNTLDNLQHSNLSQEVKDFLILYFNLKVLWKETHNYKILIQNAENIIKEFNNNYPYSLYSQYLNPLF